MFFEFGIKDIIDIVLVALMLYYIYRLMKESRSLNVFIGIMMFVVLWLLVSQILEMRLLGSIMDKLVSVGVIGLIILFSIIKVSLGIGIGALVACIGGGKLVIARRQNKGGQDTQAQQSGEQNQ